MCDKLINELDGIVIDIDHNTNAELDDPEATTIKIKMPWSPVCIGEKVKILVDYNYKG